MLFLSCWHQSLFVAFVVLFVFICLFVLLVCFVFSVVQTTREAMFSCCVGLGRITRSGRTAFSHKILFGSLPGPNFAQYVTSQPARDRRVWGKL